MNRLTEILKDSSLTTTMSDMEIDEISEEIRADFEDLIEEEKEKIRDEVMAEFSTEEKDKEISRLERKVDTLESKISQMEDMELPAHTLRDVMALEWAKANWEFIVQMEQMNKSGKELMALINKPQSIDAEAVLQHILLDEIEKTSKHKRIVLVGKAASGKDHARKLLEKQGFKYAVSYTTRPRREGEVNGVDYYFLTEEEFKAMIDRKDFYEWVAFNGWYYGTSNEQFYRDDVFIMTPTGISKLHEDDRKKCFIIYFDMDEEVRKERLSLRSDADTVERRLAADTADFENFVNFDIKITNPNF